MGAFIMKYLLIVDLMGTLLEANQVLGYEQCLLDSERKRYKDEYKSRILYISRKLNTFLDQNNNVCIITSIDHCTEERLLRVIKDIDKNIHIHNRDKIKYFITDCLDINLKQNFDRLTITFKREQAYDLAINRNAGYYYITMDDDLINASCASKVLGLGGQYILINNMLNTTGWFNSERYEYLKKHFHINDNLDRLVSYYEQCSTLFLESCNFSKEEIYLKLLSNKLDIDELYSWLILRDIKSTFKHEFGYGFDYTQELINHNCIQIYPSFEQAYQKVLIPKIK